MKDNFFLFLILLLSFNAVSSTDNSFRNIYETTYSRDNSFCTFNQQNFELQIRSIDKYSQPNDRDYGEYPFITQKGINYKLDLQDAIGRFRLVYAKEKECSKSLALPFNKDVITLFIAQDNRPYPDLLVLINYDPQLLKTEIIHTKEPIINYYHVKDKLLFSSYIPHTTMNTIEFNGKQYTLLISALPVWKSYSRNIISTDAVTTFNQFEWNHFFSDVKEFKKAYEWDETSQTFAKKNFELTFNYALRKRCLRVLNEWRCKAI